MPSREPGGRTVEQAVFAALPGEWALARTIPGRGAVTGTARFEPVGPTVLRYLEQGRLALDSGPVIDVRREHFYVLEPDRIRIAFARGGEPGETLHDLRLTASGAGPWPVRASDVHLCGADTYAGHYRFESERRITVTMLVHGPRKDYTIHSTLERPREPPGR